MHRHSFWTGVIERLKRSKSQNLINIYYYKLVTLNSMELLLNSLSKLPKSTYNLEPQKSNL